MARPAIQAAILASCLLQAATSGGSLAALGQDAGDACGGGGCEAAGQGQEASSAVHLLQAKAGHRLKGVAATGQQKEHHMEHHVEHQKELHKEELDGNQTVGLKVYAAGRNNYGQLGMGIFSGSRDSFPTPQCVEKLKHLIVVEVDTSDSTSYFRTSLGEVYAAGRNDYGQLGQGDTVNRSLPEKIRGLPPVAQLAAGDDHVLFRTPMGDVWGCGQQEPQDGCQLGVPADSGDRLSATRIKGLASGIAFSSSGEDFSLHVNILGKVVSLGENDVGQLGRGFRSDQECVPGLVPELCTVTAVAAGEDHGLLLNAQGQVFSWGSNVWGELATGHPGQGSASPVRVALLDGYKIVGIAAASRTSYFLTADGCVYAAGWNSDGQLGLGDDAADLIATPTKVLGLPPVRRIVAGNRRAFFITLDGRLFATGYNRYGQLGLGDTSGRTVPAVVPLWGVADVGAAVDDNFHTLFLAAGAL